MNNYKRMKDQLDQEFKEEMNRCIDEFAEQVKIEFNKAREESLWTQIRRTLKESLNGYTPLFCKNGDIKIYKTSRCKPCILKNERVVYLPIVENDERYILINKVRKSIELIDTTRDPFGEDNVIEISDHVYYTSEGYQNLFDKYFNSTVRS